MAFFDNYSGLYFFSAALQGNMALLAITGIFGIFRLQETSSLLRNKEADGVKLLESSLLKLPGISAVPIPRGSFKAALRWVEEVAQGKHGYTNWIRTEAQNICEKPDVKQLTSEVDALWASARPVVSAMISTMLATSAAIFASLVLLICSHWIHTLDCQLWEWISVIAVALLTLGAVGANLWFIKRVVV